MTLEKYLPLIESPLCGGNCEAVFSSAQPVYVVSTPISPFYRLRDIMQLAQAGTSSKLVSGGIKI